MKINVTENKVSIKEEQILNENEYNIHKIQFDFSSEYTDDLVKVALFSIDNHTYKKIISNNECDIPPEVLTQRGYSILGVYAYKTEQDTLVLRYSPSPTRISVYNGSYKADAENSEPITPSEIEQYQQILQNSLQQFQNQYNALVEETEGDIQAIENELQRKVDEGYFDGEDGFSPIAKVIQKSNGATIEIEDKNGKTTADVLNGEDGYTPVRGIDYWTEEDKQEVEEEATQQIEGKIEEYNENAAEKLNQYNQNSVQKTNDYNTNAEQKMSAYNTNATEKTSTYNTNATEKFNNYNSNAEQKETNYNTNASSKLSEYNSNAETKKSAYDENATQKTNSFNTNATNKLTEYNTNHTEKMSTYNNNSTEKLNAFNENATQKTEDFDEHTEEIQDNIEKLQTENARFKAILPTTGEVTGQDITLDKTAELEFKKPPLPMGNSEQVQYSGKNLFNAEENLTFSGVKTINVSIPAGTYRLTFESQSHQGEQNPYIRFDEANIGMDFDRTLDRKIILNTDVSTVYLYSNGYNYVESQGISATINKLMVSVAGGDYEPYTGGTASPNPDYPQEISNVTGDVEVVISNKNLFDKNNVAILNAYISNNTITANSSNRIFYLKVKPNTTYAITKYKSYYFTVGCVNKIPEIGDTITNIQYGPDNYRYDGSKGFLIYTTDATAQYIVCRFYQISLDTGVSLNDMLGSIQVEVNSTPTDYIEHKSQTFTFPLGNEKLMLGDYLADDGIHHVRGQVVLNGSETYLKGTEYSNSYGFVCTSFRNIINASNYTNVLCNILRASVDNEANTIRLVAANNNIAIAFDKNFVSHDVSSLTTKITQLYNNGTPIILEIPFAEEQIVPYTSAQQEVYNQIKQAISYEEQTNISGSSNGSNPIFSVEACLDSKVILAEKYVKPDTGIPKTDLASAVQTSLNKADSAIQEHQDISGKQNITDNSLTTINKTIVGAINEVDSIAKGANQALSYSNYSAMITAFNSLANNVYNVGQNVMIVTLEVPDLWISGIESTSQTYTYTTDEAFTTELNTNGYVQVGYYKLSALETQKVDLTDYATKTYVNNLFNSIVDGDEVNY